MKEQIKLGVTLYSYGADYMTTMTLEDCLADVADMGATGIEILSDTHIAGYPRPTHEWRRNWHKLLERYGLEPTCYSCWIDSRLAPGRVLTVDESLKLFRQDLELAAELGFKILRPKLGVVTWDLVPDPAWRETMERALPDAARLGITIAPEIHWPTPIQSEVVDAYMELIKATGTDHFGFVIDTGVFQDREREHKPGLTEDRLGGDIELGEAPPRPPELMGVQAQDMLPIMDHVVHIHAKFWEMTEDAQDPHIPWEPIIDVLLESDFRGYLSSEYEGERRLYVASDVLRRQHLMLRRLLAR
jgi:sugar phosphate isomerase/epimerase